MPFRPPVAAIAGLLCLGCGLASAAFPSPELLKNIRSTPRPGDVTIEATATLDDQVFLALNEVAGGKNLWITGPDGSGLTQVSPGESTGLTVSGSRLFFVRSGQLWVSDGTETGTQQLSSAGGINPPSLFPFRSGVAFLVNGRIWLSDGTPPGTQAAGGTLTEISLWGEVNGILVFSALDKAGIEIWGMNGEGDPPFRIKDIASGAAGSSPVRLGQAGNTIFFAATVKQKTTLWKTDGTAKGTVQLHTTVRPETAVWADFAVLNGRACFTGYTEKEGSEIWVTDGTVQGTHMLFESIPGAYGANVGSMTGMAGKLFLMPSYGENKFTVYDQATGLRTVITPQPNEPTLGKYPRVASAITIADGKGYFEIETQGVRALWVTDGTAAGTKPVPPAASLAPGGAAAYSGNFHEAGGRIFFSGDNLDSELAPHGLWSTDGTEAGLTLVKSFPALELGSDPQNFHTAADGTVYFRASQQLWRTDGTTEGTRLVKKLPGRVGSPEEGFDPLIRLELNGLIYFTGNPGKLWRTDGTEAGTFCLDAHLTGMNEYDPKELTVMNGILYFKAPVTGAGAELLRTDGTVAGTRLVKDIHEGTSGSDPQKLSVHNGKLYFSAYTYGEGREPWVSDGTAAGTQILSNMTREPYGSSSTLLHGFASYNGTLLINTGAGLYRQSSYDSYPTRKGETIGESISVPSGTAGPAPAPGLYYFGWRMNGQTKEYGLYRDSGAYEGAQRLRTVSERTYIGYDSYSDGYSTPFRAGGRIVYIDLGEGYIYASDGTPAGTVKLEAARATHILATTGNLIYFNWGAVLCRIRADGTDYRQLGTFSAAATDLIHVSEDLLVFTKTNSVWQTQGSAETTRRLDTPALRLASLGHATYLPGTPARVVFSGRNDLLGAEPYVVELRGCPQMSLSQESGPLILTDGQTLEMPTLLTGQSHALTLRLANAGPRPLTHVTVTGPSLPDYTLTVPLLGALASGQIVDLPLTFAPQQGGLREDTLQVTALADGLPVSLTFHLKGRGVSETDAPALLSSPASRLVMAGETVTLSAGFVAHPGTLYTWEKDGQPLITTATPELTLPGVTLTDAGTYTLTAGTPPARTSTGPVYLGVVQPPSARAVHAYPRQPLTLTCTAAGPSLSYRWQIKHEWDPALLFDTADLQGTSTAAMTFVDYAAGGLQYECKVTLTTPAGPISRVAGSIEVIHLPLPRPYLPDYYLNCFIGQEVNVQLQVVSTAAGVPPASQFKAKGLPPGLKISPTGLITGRPTQARPYNPDTRAPGTYDVQLSATNEAGIGTGWIEVVVHTLLPANTYHGLIDRKAALDGGRGLGGTLRVTTTTTGGASGQILLGGEVFRFSKVNTLTVLSSASANAEILIPRSKGRTPLTLTLTTDLFFSLDDPALGETAHTDGMISSASFSSRNPASDLKGYFTGSIGRNHPDQSPAGVPDGYGFLTSTVSPGGIATWRGKLADGTTFTGSSPLVGDLYSSAALLHLDLYKVTGSLHGTLDFYPPPQEDFPAGLAARLTWLKAPQPGTSKDRVYTAGIPLHDLDIWGESYVKPVQGEYFLNADPVLQNLRITLREGGLPAIFHQTFTIDEKNRLSLPPRNIGAPVTTLSINLSTGLIKGSLFVNHTDPKLRRTVPIEGVRSGNIVYGFFLLPSLPKPGTSDTLKTTPIASGLFDIQANSPP